MSKVALVLSGGGANGAYQVGAVGYLLTEGGIDPEILCGTSVGALNALMLAHHPLGQPLDAARALFDVWHRIRGNESVYRPWPLVDGLAALWKTSLYDTRPLRRLVEDHFDRQRLLGSQRDLAVVAVGLDSGEARVWREDDEDIVEGVLGSAAFPAAYPPVRARAESWVDGGVRDVTPIGQAIDMGAERIFVVIPEPERPGRVDTSDWTTIRLAMRSLDLLVNEVMRSDLALAYARNRLPEYREVEITVIRPSESLGDSFDFGREKNHRLIARGEADARAVLG